MLTVVWYQAIAEPLLQQLEFLFAIGTAINDFIQELIPSIAIFIRMLVRVEYSPENLASAR